MPAGPMRVDRIEKEPLFHFHPGARVLRPGFLSGSSVVTEARLGGAHCVALPLDPGPHVSKVLDAARTCRQRGLFAIGGIAGQAASEGRGVDLGAVDAATVDLTSALEVSRLRATLGRLQSVFARARTWIELVVRVVPGQADLHRSLDGMSRTIGAMLGPDVPVHFTGPTDDLDALRLARWIAISNGLHWVYMDDAADVSGLGSWCPGCDALLVARAGASTSLPGVAGGGLCARCGWRVPGRFVTALPVQAAL